MKLGNKVKPEVGDEQLPAKQCDHPISALKLVAAKLEAGHLTVQLQCGECGFGRLTKEFITVTPEAANSPAASYVAPFEPPGVTQVSFSSWSSKRIQNRGA